MGDVPGCGGRLDRMPKATNPGPDPLRLLVLGAALCVAVLLATPPIDWLPPADEARSLLGILLGAQAAITALTLAVMIFVLQGVSTRRDANDRMYREYVRQSWARLIFRGSVGAVGITGVALLAEEFGGAGAPVLDTWPSLPNLALLGAVAFVANLVLSLLLFERALLLARPEQWRRLRREVYERDVRQAVQVFIRRYRRATTKLEADEPDLADVFADPGEGSADEAVRALLDDARRAMDERRNADFEVALDFIRELVTSAMGEIERHGFTWAPPGSQPEWPPLAELSRNLYPFREEVIGRGNRDHAFALSSLDYWLLSTGVDRRCGELFTVGLQSYAANYGIISRSGGSEFHELFRDRPWIEIRGVLSALSAEEIVPYMKRIIRHQERLLSSAMHDEHPADFTAFTTGFAEMFGNVKQQWTYGIRPGPGDAGVHELEQDYRIAIMGLGGRAILLHEAGRIGDPEPYIDAARAEYSGLERLANDISQAIGHVEQGSFSLWSDWDMEGPSAQMLRPVQTDQYPLTLFSVRLLELASDPMPSLDLRGDAQQLLNWFEANAGQLEPYVRADPETSIDDRRALAIKALSAAVIGDEVAADEEMIARELSEERIAAFTADVYAAIFANNAVERLFTRAGAFEYLASAADSGLEERGASQYVSKGFLATEPENARTRYVGLEGDGWARSHAGDVIAMLREALNEAPVIETPLESGGDLLSAIDTAVDSLEPADGLLLLLSGDWNRITFDLVS